MMKNFKTIVVLVMIGMLFPLENNARTESGTQNIPGNNGNAGGKKTEKVYRNFRDYLPEIHGTVRGKFEYQPQMNAGRFEVRNARVSLTGKVIPAVAYKAEIDLSDEGTIKMLDAYARLFLSRNFDFTIGQMRVPFTIDAHRSPHQQYFANRSFIAKQVGNVRDVGATVAYRLPEGIPLTFEAGLFNGTGLTDQKVWRKTLNYSLKTQFLFDEKLNLTLGMQAIRPEEVRIRMYNIGTYYEFGNFHVEGEYIYKHYSKNAFEDVHAVNGFVNYDWKLPKVFRKISFLLRYDSMTDHSDGKEYEEIAGTETGKGRLKIDDYGRHRITGGLTFSLGKAFNADLRLNYEKYFYRRSGLAKESEQDKIVFEVMVRF